VNAEVGIINCLPPRNDPVRTVVRTHWVFWLIVVVAAVLLSLIT
jgi:hypothetical protein